MKINIGIVGYGNLGKAAEKSVLANKNLNLVAIFSRRTVSSRCNTPVESYENFKNFVGKIDVMLLCGGSKSDLEVQTPEVIKYFDAINTFDTHKKLASEHERLGEIAKASDHRLIMACGWDPGVFSVERAYFKAFSLDNPITFWGKGVSMGHSDAIRRVEGVIDAVQFTVPVKEAVKLAKSGKPLLGLPMHERQCFVVANKADQNRIEREIKEIPNYFKGQPTTVNFVSEAELARLKAKLFHRGEVISSFVTKNGTKARLNFEVSMDSNPDFTASIVIAYINAIINLKEEGKSGAFTCLDIPPNYLFLGSEKENLISTLC